ncbi:tellurite resistance TerB family protein [Jannaschia sp. LMIT008]|uniref:tellurite resistance TerB family protein n=1 Tax=Jannaschia maritima TaxID=3032585 RepID=UPI0028114667|nr:tellurite resistance TerB family protein [Jannaschia sp. LMIT008]
MTNLPPDSAFSPQDALVALMITVSASDANIRTAELLTIQSIVNHLPLFAAYEDDRIEAVAQIVFDLLEDEDGLEQIYSLIREYVPPSHFETAYALACDVAAADGDVRQSELRLLRELTYELDLDPLHAAAIERGARARHLPMA